jgi:hypothetical protein
MADIKDLATNHDNQSSSYRLNLQQLPFLLFYRGSGERCA